MPENDEETSGNRDKSHKEDEAVHDNLGPGKGNLGQKRMLPAWLRDVVLLCIGVPLAFGISWGVLRGDVVANTEARGKHARELADLRAARTNDMAEIRKAIYGNRISHGKRVAAAAAKIDVRLDAVVVSMTEVITSVKWMRAHYEADAMRARNDVRDLLRQAKP